MTPDDAVPDRMADEVVVVTGGTRGIGRATTTAFAARGATVVAGYRSDDERAAETRSALESAPGRVETRRFDVADRDAVRDAFEAVAESHGEVTVLVNNAGVLRRSLLLRMDPEEWSETLATNLTGTFNCTGTALRSMIRGDGGSIVNVSSVAARRSWAGQANYVASKAGIEGFTRAAARELARLDVRVNAVAPGLVETGSYSDLVEDDADAGASEDIPLERIARPAEVAECILFLASERASYVTGEVLRIDGGMLA